MSDTTKAPALPGPSTETTTVPKGGGKRRAGAFQHQETRAPDRGRSLEDAMSELARRRTAGETQRRTRTKGGGDVYTAPDGQRIAVPPAQQPSLMQPGPVPVPPPEAPLGIILPTQPLAGAPSAAPAPAAVPPAQLAQPPPTPVLAAGDPAQSVLVNIDGHTEPVALGELVNGYLRHRDYSAKTQQASIQLKIALDAQAAFAAVRDRLEKQLTEVVAANPDEFAKPVDWAALSNTDPIGCIQKQARFLARQQAQEELARIAEDRAREEMGRKLFAVHTGNETLCRVVPGWADPQMRVNLQQQMKEHLRRRMFTPEQIEQRDWTDPRDIIILLEAMLWAQHITRGVAQPAAPVGRTVSGNGVGAAETRNGAHGGDLAALDERFGRTHRLDDALELLQARRRARGS